MKNVLNILCVLILCLSLFSCDNVKIVDITEDIEVIVDNVDDTKIEPSLENMVKIDALNLYVDIYELSIAEYIKEFPDETDILIERAEKTNLLRRLIPPFTDYPAIITYEQAVEYAERVGKRIMTIYEWEFIAKGMVIEVSGTL